MQTVVMVLVAAAAVAAVFYPLLKGRAAAGSGDLDPPAPPRASSARPAGAAPARPEAQADGSAEPNAIGKRFEAPTPPRPGATPTPAAVAARSRSDVAAGDPFEAEVLRYREALRAGTVCGACRQANPPGSRFCFECGQPLDEPPAGEAGAEN